MKTLEQVLEGVTAEGKWKASKASKAYKDILNLRAEEIVMPTNADAAYAARACSNFPALVRVLTDLLDNRPGRYGKWDRDKAKATLAEALKD